MSVWTIISLIGVVYIAFLMGRIQGFISGFEEAKKKYDRSSELVEQSIIIGNKITEGVIKNAE